MARPSFLGDPLWRGTFARVLLASAFVALISQGGPAWAAGGVVVVAAALAFDLIARLDPLRRKVAALGGEGPGRVGLRALAARVDQARGQLAEALRKAELERDDLLGVLEAASEGILVLGHHHRIELINDAARRLLEPDVEPLGRSLPEVCGERRLLEFAEELRAGETPEPVWVELTRGATTRSVFLSGEHVRGGSLRNRAVLVLRDLTDLRHLERVRTDFVANATHELRSPLASILGFAETLEEDTSMGSPEVRDALGRIVRNAHRMDDVISDLIELSRLEHATAPEASPADPAILVHRVAETFRDRASEKSIELETELVGLPPSVEIDSALVLQALTNLVDNAIKYTPAGGRVRVSARIAPRGDSGRERLEFEVSDTGPGIPQEHRARVFERFYRVDTARSRAVGGTGLGLAIVKHAAALHGGRVHLDSGPEGGALFRLEVPL